MDAPAPPADAYGVLPTGAYTTEEVHALIVNLDTAARQAVRLEARVEALMAENAALRARLERATDVSRRLLDEREAGAEPEAPAWTPPPLPAQTGPRLVAPAGA